MNLQTLTVIFVVIALPVIIIMSVYVEYQVDTATLRSQYKTYLIEATYNTMKAFELNTASNKYSTVSDSLIRDIEAALVIFSSNFSSSLGKSNSSSSDVLAYVPAIVFTLYDGYYIYMPTASAEDGTFEHTLKPYVYYTEEYVQGKNRIVINYSIDNYVAVYFYNDTDGQYTSKSGYLEILTTDRTASRIVL